MTEAVGVEVSNAETAVTSEHLGMMLLIVADIEGTIKLHSVEEVVDSTILLAGLGLVFLLKTGKNSLSLLLLELLFLLKFLKIWVPDLNCVITFSSLRPLSSSGDLLLLLLVYGRNSTDLNLVTAVSSTSRFGPSDIFKAKIREEIERR
ncbi:hypothetical protein C0J52_15330 [Blattella germanica]|nr:hypothetical protein C0J52_15330 [Blattella germanica]